jgi:hypothetical protein
MVDHIAHSAYDTADPFCELQINNGQLLNTIMALLILISNKIFSYLYVLQ